MAAWTGSLFQPKSVDGRRPWVHFLDTASFLVPPCAEETLGMIALGASSRNGPYLDPDEQLIITRLLGFRREYMRKGEQQQQQQQQLDQQNVSVSRVLAAIWYACRNVEATQPWAKLMVKDPEGFRCRFCLQPTILTLWTEFIVWIEETSHLWQLEDQTIVGQRLTPIFLLHGLARELIPADEKSLAINGLGITIHRSMMMAEILVDACSPTTARSPSAPYDLRTAQHVLDDTQSMNVAINHHHQPDHVVSMLIRTMSYSDRHVEFFKRIIRRCDERLLAHIWNTQPCRITLLTFCLSTELIPFGDPPVATLALLQPEFAQDDGSGICIDSEIDKPYFEQQLERYKFGVAYVSETHQQIATKRCIYRMFETVLQRQTHYRTHVLETLNSTLGAPLLPPLISLISSYIVVMCCSRK